MPLAQRISPVAPRAVTQCALIALVVEPDRLDDAIVEDILASKGWSVIRCDRIVDAVRYASRRDISIVFCDYAPYAGFDEEAIRALRTARGSLPMVLVARPSSAAEALVSALHLNCLSTPLSSSDVEEALEQAHLEFEPF